MSVIRSTIRLFLGLTAIAVVALTLAMTLAATPGGPCAVVPFVGVCVPVGGEQPAPPSQNYGEYAYLAG